MGTCQSTKDKDYMEAVRSETCSDDGACITEEDGKERRAQCIMGSPLKVV